MATVATVYSSLEIHTAVEEALAHHRHFGFPVEMAVPRVLVAIQARLERTLDLTDARPPQPRRHARPTPERRLARLQRPR